MPLRLFLCGLLLLALAGCTRRPATGTVTGEVTLDSQPIVDGRITFIPADGLGQTAGAEIKDGKFTATEVPVAKMKVEINANQVVGKYYPYETNKNIVKDLIKEIVPPKYNVESELMLDVQPKSQEVRYDLKSK